MLQIQHLIIANNPIDLLANLILPLGMKQHSQYKERRRATNRVDRDDTKHADRVLRF
jgi:hypothetical protein